MRSTRRFSFYCLFHSSVAFLLVVWCSCSSGMFVGGAAECMHLQNALVSKYISFSWAVANIRDVEGAFRMCEHMLERMSENMRCQCHGRWTWASKCAVYIDGWHGQVTRAFGMGSWREQLAWAV